MVQNTRITEEAELRGLGLRVTAPRIAILATLRAAPEPLSIETILGRLPRGSADQATVYRTLESFVQKGLVHEVVFVPGRTLYELVGDEHHHIVCTRCGRVEDIHIEDCGRFERDALRESKYFKHIERHALELFGICDRCA